MKYQKKTQYNEIQKKDNTMKYKKDNIKKTQ